MLKYALYYAKNLGWSIFPVEPREKVPLARLVPHGVDNATNDVEKIREWWGNYPNANIGVSCELSDLAIVDLDTPESTKRWKLILEALGYDKKYTAIVETSRGEHWYFYQPVERKMTNAQKGKRKDGSVDIEKIERRGVGGYVVLPPSVHPSGAIYKWKEGYTPKQGIARMPLNLLDAIQIPASPIPTAPVPPLPRAEGEAERHAQNIVKKIARKLAYTPNGAWHGEIRDNGRFVGGFVGSGLVDKDWAYQIVLSSTASRKDFKDSARTLMQAIEYGMKFPIYPEEG